MQDKKSDHLVEHNNLQESCKAPILVRNMKEIRAYWIRAKKHPNRHDGVYLNEAFEFDNIQNQYYGRDFDECTRKIKIEDNPYYGGDFDFEPNQIKVVENPYYDGENLYI